VCAVGASYEAERDKACGKPRSEGLILTVARRGSSVRGSRKDSRRKSHLSFALRWVSPEDAWQPIHLGLAVEGLPESTFLMLDLAGKVAAVIVQRTAAGFVGPATKNVTRWSAINSTELLKNYNGSISLRWNTRGYTIKGNFPARQSGRVGNFDAI